MQQVELETRVGIAADWFDRNHPGWYDRIDLGTLALWSPSMCVCGQQDLDWNEVRDQIQRDTNVVMAGAFSGVSPQPYWQQEILARRETPPEPPKPPQRKKLVAALLAKIT